MLALLIVYCAMLWGVSGFMKKHPDMISGYSTMPKERLQNIDLQAVGDLYCKGLRLIVLLTIVLFFLFRWLAIFQLFAFLVPLFIITPILSIKAQKYDNNPRNTFAKYLSTCIIILLFIVVSLVLLLGLNVPIFYR